MFNDKTIFMVHKNDACVCVWRGWGVLYVYTFVSLCQCVCVCVFVGVCVCVYLAYLAKVRFLWLWRDREHSWSGDHSAGMPCCRNILLPSRIGRPSNVSVTARTNTTLAYTNASKTLHKCLYTSRDFSIKQLLHISNCFNMGSQHNTHNYLQLLFLVDFWFYSLHI